MPTETNELNETVTLTKYKLKIMLGQAFEQGVSWTKIPAWYNGKDVYIEKVFQYDLPKPEENIPQQVK